MCHVVLEKLSDGKGSMLDVFGKVKRMLNEKGVMDQKQDETNQKLDETTFQLTIYNQCA